MFIEDIGRPNCQPTSFRQNRVQVFSDHDRDHLQSLLLSYHLRHQDTQDLFTARKEIVSHGFNDWEFVIRRAGSRCLTYLILDGRASPASTYRQIGPWSTYLICSNLRIGAL